MGAGAVGAYFLYKAYSKGNALKHLTYTNPKITVGKFSLLSGLALQIKLDFVNNSSEDLSLEYFTGNINYQGKTLAGFTFNGNGQNQVIKARCTTTIPFTVQLKTLATLNVISQLVTALTTHTGVSTVLNIDGSFYAAGFDVPVNFFYDLKAQSSVSRPANMAGIGSTSARLSFKNNEEMINFFRQDQIKRFKPKYGFSKN